MHFISKRVVVLGVVATLGFAGTAQAAVDDTTVVLTGGTLDLRAPLFGNFPGATLDGSSDSQDASVSTWGVNDPSGSARGWSVSMAASALVTADTVPITMDGAVISIAEPVASPVDSTNTSTEPTMLGGSISASRNVAVAAANEGLGDWDFTQGATDLTLATPANARAGSYTSTITTTLTQGV